MKKITGFILLLFISFQGFSQGLQVSQGGILMAPAVANLAQLSTLNPFHFTEVDVLGFYHANDGGGDHFYYDDTSTATPVPGFIVQIGSTPTGRWKRKTSGTSFDMRQFGYLADGITNNVTAITLAGQYVFGLGGGTLYFPPGTAMTDSFPVYSMVRYKGSAFAVSMIKMNAHSNRNLVTLSSSTNYRITMEDMTFHGNGSQQDSTWCRCLYFNGAGSIPVVGDPGHYWNNLKFEYSAGTAVEMNGRGGGSIFNNVNISNAGLKSVNHPSHRQGAGAIINIFDGNFFNWQSGYNAGTGIIITSSDNIFTGGGCGGNGSGDSLNAYGFYIAPYQGEIRLVGTFSQANQSHNYFLDRAYDCQLVGTGSSEAGSSATFTGGTYGFKNQSAYYMNFCKGVTIVGSADGTASCQVTADTTSNTSWALTLNGGDHSNVTLTALFMAIGGLHDIGGTRLQNTININATDTIGSCATNNGVDCSYTTIPAQTWTAGGVIGDSLYPTNLAVNVGIGTITPRSGLEVNRNVLIDSPMVVNAPITGTEALTVSANTNETFNINPNPTAAPGGSVFYKRALSVTTGAGNGGNFTFQPFGISVTDNLLHGSSQFNLFPLSYTQAAHDSNMVSMHPITINPGPGDTLFGATAIPFSIGTAGSSKKIEFFQYAGGSHPLNYGGHILFDFRDDNVGPGAEYSPFQSFVLRGANKFQYDGYSATAVIGTSGPFLIGPNTIGDSAHFFRSARAGNQFDSGLVIGINSLPAGLIFDVEPTTAGLASKPFSVLTETQVAALTPGLGWHAYVSNTNKLKRYNGAFWDPYVDSSAAIVGTLKINTTRTGVAGDSLLATSAGTTVGKLALGTGLSVTLGVLNATGGFTNPMTAVGDMILGGTSGAATRAAIGPNGYLWASNGTTAAWTAPVASTDSAVVVPLTGSVLTKTVSGTSIILNGDTSRLDVKASNTYIPGQKTYGQTPFLNQQPMATGVQHLGFLYDSSTWNNLSQFTVDGATASVSSNKIAFTGGSVDFNSSLDWNYYTGLEKWKMTAKVKVGTVNGSSYGLSIGTRSMNPQIQYNLGASVNLSSNSPTGVLTIWGSSGESGGSGILSLATSGTNVSLVAGNEIIIVIERNFNQVTATAWNQTTNGAPVTCTYTFTTGYLPTSLMPNTSKFAVYNFGGSEELDSLSILSNEVKYADILLAGDSKFAGYFEPSYGGRVASLLSNDYVVVNNSGGADRSSDMLNKIVEIDSLHPKNVIECIGRNDLSTSVTMAVISANIDTMTARWQRAGINVFHMLPLYETGQNQDSLTRFLIATFPASQIIDSKGYQYSGSASSINNVDGIHPNAYYNTLIAAAIKDQFPTKYNKYAPYPQDLTSAQVTNALGFTPATSLGNAAANTVYGNNTGSSTTPAFQTSISVAGTISAGSNITSGAQLIFSKESTSAITFENVQGTGTKQGMNLNTTNQVVLGPNANVLLDSSSNTFMTNGGTLATNGGIAFGGWVNVTTGTSSTISTAAYNVLFNPATAISTYSITMPASPFDGQEIRMFFGGAITSGTVVTSLNVSPNSGQSIIGTPVSSTVAATTNSFIWVYNKALTTWFRQQ